MMREFLFEYHFGGETWGITIHARDAVEAREKIKVVGLARYKGEVAAKIPAGPVGRLISWLRRHRDDRAGGRTTSNPL